MNQDYLLDDDGDLLIANGDFVVGPSDNQHIRDILVSFQGEWKQFPLIGAGIITAINSSEPHNQNNNAKDQLQSGGYQLDRINIFIDDSGKLQIQFPKGIFYNAVSNQI